MVFLISSTKTRAISPDGEVEVQLFTNDLSFHGQFSDISSFRVALRRVMEIREIARRFGRQLHCHRNIAQAQVTHTQRMQQAVQALNQDERRALMQWLTQQGPFWEDTRSHGLDDYLSFNDLVVTDTAVGEAAYGWGLRLFVWVAGLA